MAQNGCGRDRERVDTLGRCDLSRWLGWCWLLAAAAAADDVVRLEVVRIVVDVVDGRDRFVEPGAGRRHIAHGGGGRTGSCGRCQSCAATIVVGRVVVVGGVVVVDGIECWIAATAAAGC